MTHGGILCLPSPPLWALRGALGLLCSGPAGKEWHLGGCDWPWPAGGDQAAATHVAGRPLWRTRVTTWVSSALDVSGHMQQPWLAKGVIIKGSEASGMKAGDS